MLMVGWLFCWVEGANGWCVEVAFITCTLRNACSRFGREDARCVCVLRAPYSESVQIYFSAHVLILIYLEILLELNITK